MEKYNIIENIGDGTYGTVYKAVNTKTSKIK
jgi:serine/threonine protein kinase